jgi:flagellar basal body-associated protein FliL
MKRGQLTLIGLILLVVGFMVVVAFIPAITSITAPAAESMDDSDGALKWVTILFPALLLIAVIGAFFYWNSVVR